MIDDPGDIAKYDSDYKRNGTVSLFCFIQPHTGRIVYAVEPTRTAVDWAEKICFLVDTVVSEAETITHVMDNLNTCNIASFYKAFPPEEARRIARKSKFITHLSKEAGLVLRRSA